MPFLAPAHWQRDKSAGDAVKQAGRLNIHSTIAELSWLTRPWCHWCCGNEWGNGWFNINSIITTLGCFAILPWASCQGQGAFDVIEIGLKQTNKVQRIMTHWCKIPSSKPDIMKDSPKMCICFPCWEVWRAFVCFAAMTVVRAKDRAGGRVTLPSKPSNPHTQLR